MLRVTLFALLVLSSVAAAAQQAPTVQVSPLGPNSALLSLNAEGRSRRVPDLAVFNAGVVTQGATAAEALSANSRQMERVVDALKRAGIADRDLVLIRSGRLEEPSPEIALQDAGVDADGDFLPQDLDHGAGERGGDLFHHGAARMSAAACYIRPRLSK